MYILTGVSRLAFVVYLFHTSVVGFRTMINTNISTYQLKNCQNNTEYCIILTRVIYFYLKTTKK